jgi:hypothetical protein
MATNSRSFFAVVDPSEPDEDMLGDPFEYGSPRKGRKRHKHSAYVAGIVATRAAMNETQAAIAERVGLSVPTLTKVYFRELERGLEMLKAAILERQVRKAIEDGSAASARLALEQIEKAELANGQRKRPGSGDRPRSADATPSEPTGKKELARQAALTAGEGSDWGDDLKFPLN